MVAVNVLAAVAVAEAVNVLVAVAEAVAVNVLVAVAEAAAVNVLVAVAVAVAVAEVLVMMFVLSRVLRVYESEGKWMPLFRDMICVFFY